MTLPIDLIRLIRGPYDAMPSAVGTLLEGEGALLTVFDVGGSAFTMTWYGGHDGQNKIQGGGFPTIDYEGPPQFVVQPGLVGNGVAAVVDSACNLWVSSDGTCSCAVAVGASGTGTGTGTGTGVGYWCKIAGCGGGGGGGGIQEIDTQAPILGGPITVGQTGTISHAISGVTPGSYTNVNITVDEWGHVTEVSNGSSTPFTNRLYLTCNPVSVRDAFTPQTIYSYTAPANTMVNGTVIRCRAAGNYQSVSSTNLIIALTVGTSAVQVISCDQRNAIYNSGDWTIEFELMLDSTGNLFASGTFLLGGSVSGGTFAGGAAPSVATIESVILPSDRSLPISLVIQPNDGVLTAILFAVWKE